MKWVLHLSRSLRKVGTTIACTKQFRNKIPPLAKLQEMGHSHQRGTGQAKVAIPGEQVCVGQHRKAFNLRHGREQLRAQTQSSMEGRQKREADNENGRRKNAAPATLVLIQGSLTPKPTLDVAP